MGIKQKFKHREKEIRKSRETKVYFFEKINIIDKIQLDSPKRETENSKYQNQE